MRSLHSADRSARFAALRASRQGAGYAISWVAALLASCALNSKSVNGGDVAPPEIPFEKYALDNGLTVILHRDNRLPLVAVSVWYDVGALHEPKGRSGFAHLFEHMMFQGSPHVGTDQHFPILESIGATQVNGTTDYDRTNYFETVPSNELEKALWLESDRMGFLLSSLTKAALDNQIEVVSNERRQSIENRPYGLMNEAIMQTIYPPTHPYHGNVIGSLEEIAAATLGDVQEFFRTYYTPANATLVVAGDIDTAAAKQLVTKYFASLQGKPKPPKVTVAAPTIGGEKIVDFAEPIAKLAKLSMIWMGPSAFEADTATLDLLSHVISGTRSSRLDKRVSHDELIAESVTCYFQETKSGGMFQIDLVVRPDKTLDEAQKAIDEVLADLAARPPTAAELERAKNAQLTHLIRGLESLGGFSGRAERLQLYQNFFGEPGKLGWDLDRYQKVTLEDLARAQAKYLTKNRLVVRAAPKPKEAK
jgi:zinc protease